MISAPHRRTFFRLSAALLAGCARRGARSVEEERKAPDVPGVVIAHVKRGGANEVQSMGALRVDDVVEVASLSKPVFALAVLQRAARGSIDLDAPLPGLSPPPYPHVRRGVVDRFDDPRLAQLTPRLVLSHRSGLPNWSRDRPLAFDADPGGAWSYSGEAYVLLQHVLESRFGATLDAFVRAEVLSPLGMNRSSFDPKTVARRARGHARDGAPLDSTLDAPSAATSLLAPVSDYARFVAHLLDAAEDDVAVRTLLSRQVSVDESRGISWGVGVGLAQPDWFFHWGANPGFRSLFVASRARGEGVVVLTDGDGGMEIAADVVRTRFGDLPLLGFPMLYPND